MSRAGSGCDEHHAYLDADAAARARAGRRRSTSSTTTASTTSRSRWRATLPMPMLTTLHTPPTPVAGVGDPGRRQRRPARFVGRQRAHRAARGGTCCRAHVVHNGVDASRWTPGPGRRAGRSGPAGIVPEKAPHLAIEAAVAGRAAAAARRPGRRPRLLRRRRSRRGSAAESRYLGHLDHAALVRLVGAARGRARDAGLGRAVRAGRRRGAGLRNAGRAPSRAAACREFVDDACGGSSRPATCAALAARDRRGAGAVTARPRARHAVERCSVERMVDRYEEIYDRSTAPPRLAA